MAVKRKQFPLGIDQVDVGPGYIGSRVASNNKISIADQYRKCLNTGRIEAIKLGWKPGMDKQPHRFWDSDVAKWVQAACLSLKKQKNKRIADAVEQVVDLFIASQQPDGYVNSYFTTVKPDKRWTNLAFDHELYSAGHLMEAAVAHRELTGDEKFFNCARRFADYIATVFGPEKGQLKGYPGHQEIELALVKLYRASKDKKYLELAKFFLDQLGTAPNYFVKEQKKLPENESRSLYIEYIQMHKQAYKPVRQQTRAVGHAVRACYMYCAMADVAAETNDAQLLSACKKIFKNIATTQMYITGGVGSMPAGEAFTYDYNLPNMHGYAETCAAIALAMFAHRMLQIDPDSKYADVMERAIYNNVLAGISLRGSKYFYANLLRVEPQAVTGFGRSSIHAERQELLDCFCCPSNVSRMIAEIGTYMYTSARQGPLYVHLYANSTANLRISTTDVKISQQTNYPWDGEVKLTVAPAEPLVFSLMLRLPEWCENYNVRINGKVVNDAPVKKGYIMLRQEWTAGDTVELSLEMKPMKIAANPAVTEDTGKTAIQRGPLVYCLEQCDNSADVLGMSIPDGCELKERFDRKLLGGCVVIEGTGVVESAAGWTGKLYRPADKTSQRMVKFKAVPYALWCNRKPGKMTVWIPLA